MSELGQLNITVGASIDPLVSGLNSAKDQLLAFDNQAGGSFDNLSAGADTASMSVAGLQKQLDLLILAQSRVAESNPLWAEYEAGIQATGLQIQNLEQQELDLATANQQLADSAIGASEASGMLGQTAQGTTNQALNLDRGIGQLAIGLQQGQVSMFGLMSAMRGGIGAFKEGTAATGDLAGGFEALGASLLSPESLIFLVVIGISELANSFFKASKTVDEFTKTQTDATKAMDDAHGKAMEEGVQIDILAEKAANLNISYNERLDAVDKLQKEYPSVLGNLSQEAILTGNIKDALTELNQQLLNKALYEAASSDLSKYASQLREVQKQLNEAKANVALYNKELSQPASSGGEGGSSSVGPASLVKEETGKVNELTGKYTQLQTVINSTISDMKDFASKTGELLTGSPIENAARKKLAKVKTEAESITGILNKLHTELSTLDKTQISFGIDEDPSRLTAYKTAITDLFKLGLNPSDTIIGQLVGKFDEIQFQNEFEKARTKAIEELSKASAETFKKFKPNLGPTETQVEDYFTTMGTTSHSSIENDAKIKNKEILDQGKKIMQMAQQISGAFDQVFTTMMTKGQMSFKVIEQALVGLIAKMVKAIIEAAILSAVLSTITGGADIAKSLGFGGTGFKSILGGLTGIVPHAEGGIFNQPTLLGNHLFGEAGPEAVIPLDRLNDITSGMHQNNIQVTGESRIEGSTLVTVYTRAQARNTRNYGGNL